MEKYNDDMIDDITKLLDEFVSKNGGHMNIDVSDMKANCKKVEKANSLECSSKNMSCGVPTIFEGTEDTD